MPYERISSHPYYLLNISDIFATFGAFMAVLIAIEIFISIISYLRENVIHIEIVLATAFMAVAARSLCQIAFTYLRACLEILAALGASSPCTDPFKTSGYGARLASR